MIFPHFADRLIQRAERRAADVVIGGTESPYLRRWHQFLRSDDDRALHDHPWFNVSVLLRGEYVEHTIAAGGIHHRAHRRAGSIAFRPPWRAHRIALLPKRVVKVVDGKRTWRDVELPCWSLFVTGPRLRRWGFHCPDAGWVHWRAFTDPATNGATVGKGCAQ